MHPREHLREGGVGHALLAHEAVVAVLVEILVEAEGRLVNPHEPGVADHEGQGEHGPEAKFRRLHALGLGAEALTGAIGTGASRVERGKAPFGDEERCAALVVERADGVHERRTVLARQHDAPVEVGPWVAVERDDVAVATGGLQHHIAGAHAGEAAAQHHVVRVVAADCAGRHGEVALRDKREEGDLGLAGNLALSRREIRFSHKGHRGHKVFVFLCVLCG